MTEKVELRGDIARDVCDVLDALAKARRVSRMEIVAEALKAFADQVVHESTLVARLTRREGTVRDS